MSSQGGVFTLGQPSAILRDAHVLSQEVWSVPGKLLPPGASSWHVCRLLPSAFFPELPPLPLLCEDFLSHPEPYRTVSLMTRLRSHQHPRECSRIHPLLSCYPSHLRVLFVSPCEHLQPPSLTSPHSSLLPSLSLLPVSTVTPQARANVIPSTGEQRAECV